MQKLTLSAPPEVIARAKRLASRRRTSVSAMFVEYVSALSRQEKPPLDVPPDSIAARMTGIITLPKGKTPRDVITEALMEKYDIKP